MPNTLRKKKKQRKPKKRFDLTSFNKTLEGMGFTKGFCTCLGIVKEADDGGLHFDLDGSDLTVEVDLMPSLTPITVRVGSVAGGPMMGVWGVPPAGAEVLVAIPDGDFDFEPMICSWYSSGQLPDDIGPTTLVIAAPSGGEVYIHDGTGGVDQLVTKTAYEAHLHPSGMGPTGVPNNATAPTSYTQVLKAK